MKSFQEFKRALALRESSGNYRAENPLGYLGAFQFGSAELCDLGLMHRKNPASRSCRNEDFDWNFPCSKESFLRDTQLQEICFARHVRSLRRQLAEFYQGDNLSGAVAACHLVGVHAFREWILRGIQAADANGVTAEEYYREFAGYSLS